MDSLKENFELFQNIIENSQTDIINLPHVDSLTPTTLLPLFNYMKNKQIDQYIPHEGTQNYLKELMNKEIHNTTNIYFKTFLKRTEKTKNEIINEINNLLNKQTDINSFNFLLEEIITNIINHSKSKKSYLLCQEFPKNEITDLCFIDNGISIPGSFEESNIEFTTDADAIFKAVNGCSSNYFEYEEHGYGLNTSAQLVTLGFKRGEMIIASRGAYGHIVNGEIKLFKTKEKYVPGTFISLRVDNKHIDKEIFNKYICKLKKINLIK